MGKKPTDPNVGRVLEIMVEGIKHGDNQVNWGAFVGGFVVVVTLVLFLIIVWPILVLLGGG